MSLAKVTVGALSYLYLKLTLYNFNWLETDAASATGHQQYEPDYSYGTVCPLNCPQ